jgi:hypothetical protein
LDGPEQLSKILNVGRTQIAGSLNLLPILAKGFGAVNILLRVSSKLPRWHNNMVDSTSVCIG